MGTRDVEAFRAAGKTLFSLGLVKGSEGNLSTFDGESLTITRSGSELAQLGDEDVLEGSLGEPPSGASSDLDIHVAYYRERGPGAVAHAHPPGTGDEGGPGEHGAYAVGSALEEATRAIVEEVRGG